MDDFVKYLPFFLVFIACGSVHEFFHSWSAYRLGDRTSRDLGRLTLNPLAHIDLFGTIVVPLVTLYVMHIPFGWMKPVPVSTRNLRRPRRDMLWISLAGPYSNLLLAFIGFAVILALQAADISIPRALEFWVIINLLLAYLNLLPVPPLDGSSLLEYFLGPRSARFLHQGWLGIFLIFCLFLFGFQWLAEATYNTCAAMTQYPVLAMLFFVGLLVTGSVVFWKTRSQRSVRVRVPNRTDARQQIFRVAEAIGRKLAEGQTLSDPEKEWLETIRLDPGDGQELCASLSFNLGNDFCYDCANFNRCAARLVDELAQEKNVSN